MLLPNEQDSREKSILECYSKSLRFEVLLLKSRVPSISPIFRCFVAYIYLTLAFQVTAVIFTSAQISVHCNLKASPGAFRCVWNTEQAERNEKSGKDQDQRFLLLLIIQFSNKDAIKESLYRFRHSRLPDKESEHPG
jgi:hypothetical protein